MTYMKMLSNTVKNALLFVPLCSEVWFRATSISFWAWAESSGMKSIMLGILTLSLVHLDRFVCLHPAIDEWFDEMSKAQGSFFRKTNKTLVILSIKCLHRRTQKSVEKGVKAA